jgi:hypothetical protein
MVEVGDYPVPIMSTVLAVDFTQPHSEYQQEVMAVQ